MSFDRNPYVRELAGLINVVKKDRAVDVVDQENLDWHSVDTPNRLRKVVTFQDRESLVYVVNELLAYEDEMNHHGRITIEGKTLIVEIYTKSINDITNVDREYASYIDAILTDAVEISNAQRNVTPYGWDR